MSASSGESRVFSKSFLNELGSGWSLSSQVVSGEPAGMTALTTNFRSMTAYEAFANEFLCNV